MTIVNVEPTKEKALPYDTDDEIAPTLLEQLAVAGNTVEMQVALGASLNLSEEDAAREKELLEAVLRKQKPDGLKKPNTAFAAASFLRTYGAQLGLDVSGARAAITNKLMEIANCGEIRFELKALELLGKHSDIGLFTSRSEITINYKNPEDLEKAIKERVKRLLNADVIDVTPVGLDLDDELGIFDEVEESEADQSSKDQVLDAIPITEEEQENVTS